MARAVLAVSEGIRSCARGRVFRYVVGTAQYNLVPPAASGLSRPWLCAGHLWSEDPEGATPAGLEVVVGPVAHRRICS
ncbi:unnamed protein product [Prunus armeniaca]